MIQSLFRLSGQHVQHGLLFYSVSGTAARKLYNSTVNGAPKIIMQKEPKSVWTNRLTTEFGVWLGSIILLRTIKVCEITNPKISVHYILHKRLNLFSKLTFVCYNTLMFSQKFLQNSADTSFLTILYFFPLQVVCD